MFLGENDGSYLAQDDEARRKHRETKGFVPPKVELPPCVRAESPITQDERKRKQVQEKRNSDS